MVARQRVRSERLAGRLGPGLALKADLDDTGGAGFRTVARSTRRQNSMRYAPMANKSNNSNQTISLPQGGGALHGIGETFSPDLHTGSGNFTVPIALPPGRNGFQPQLNLVYSTGNGNGPLGW